MDLPEDSFNGATTVTDTTMSEAYQSRECKGQVQGGYNEMEETRNRTQNGYHTDIQNCVIGALPITKSVDYFQPRDDKSQIKVTILNLNQVITANN